MLALKRDTSCMRASGHKSESSIRSYACRLSEKKEMSATLMPSCATVDQVSRAHGLILGSGKPGLKLTCHHLNRRHICFNIKSIPVHPLLWMNVMLDFICMVFTEM